MPRRTQSSEQTQSACRRLPSQMVGPGWGMPTPLQAKRKAACRCSHAQHVPGVGRGRTGLSHASCPKEPNKIKRHNKETGIKCYMSRRWEAGREFFMVKAG